VVQHGASVERFTLESELVGRSLEHVVVTPKGGGEGRPLLVLLHGYGSEPASYLRRSWFDALAEFGNRAPDLLLVNGGDSFYHDRADGRWGSYVLDEVIPAAVRKLDADGSRIAIGGISMGGFGALDIALANPDAFCAVGGHSAALWRSAAEAPVGTFDNAQDFSRNDVLALARSRLRPFGRARIWIDVGTSDSFYSADAELARTLGLQDQSITFNSWPGDHSDSYWDEHVVGYMRFYADALAAC
jgi:S-formylglutathione hydrolase FrmB